MKTNNVISQITFKAAGLLLTWCLLFFAPEASGQGYSLSTITDKVWCVSSYNSDTITVSFSIDELAATGFDELQTDQDIYIELPNNFEFVPGQGTVTYAAGKDIGNIDAFAITAGTAGPNTRIDVQIDVPTEAVCCDTLYFNNFKIFATALGSGAVTRNGGTLTLDGANTNPTGAEAFGNLTATTMLYTSSTVTQGNTSTVPQFSVYNEVIGIEIVATNACNPLDVTQFDLSTLGTPGSTDPANDIGEARIYYTGTSGTYAKTTLFGTLGSSPSGAFSITGTQTLAEGTNYFWLTYDIKKAATPTTNDVDARLDSIEIDGAWEKDMAVSDPAGKRTITALTTVYTVTEFVSPVYCGGYPTAYITDSFAINEVVANAFGKNQTAATIEFTLPAGFEFNTGAGTISSAAGGDITSVNIVSLTTTVLTVDVTIPDTDGDDDLDTIFFNDFQIRATAGGVIDSLVRTGGTFLVYELAIEPPVSFADLNSLGMAYTSSTVTQTNTSTVPQFSVYNEVIGIEIVTTNACNPLDVTQFDLSTLGTPGSTDPANDIGEARIYYTGTSGTYAKTTLFGTLGSSPSGAFSITGTQTLAEGTNYFWLTYDIKKAATPTTNDVDARLDSIEIDGAWEKDMAVSDPAGKRSITALTTVYSVTEFVSSVYCGAYPTAYVTNSFSINEVVANAFGKNQTTATIELTLPAGFEFNTGAGTVDSAIAGDITSINIVSLTTTVLTIEVTIPDIDGDDALDTIFFNDFQIRATAGDLNDSLIRTGGTFVIYELTTEPTVSFADLSSGMRYTSSTVTQTNTSNVTQFSVGNAIIGIEVVTTNACSPFDVTQFDFSTLGTPGSTDPANDISEATIYYTGTSGSYAQTSLFGTLGGSPPAGAFSITGTQTLVEGTNYFWLTYDVPFAATAGDTVDASLDSMEIDGAWKKDMTVSDPAGKRTIAALNPVYYSRASTNWDLASTWSIAGCNGAIAPSAPGPTDDAVICDGHTVTLVANDTISNITVQSGGTLSNNGNNMIVTGNFTVDGTFFDPGGMGEVTLTGASTFIDGIGTVNAGGMNGVTISDGGSGGDKFIRSTANLTITGKVIIENGLTLTNFGTISIQDNIEGQNAASTWINEINSTLNAGKQLMNQGELFTSASGNTVNYNQAGNQNITTPDANTYWHLQAQGNGIKKLFSNTIVLGDLTIASTLDCNFNNINLAGNWINSGTFTAQAETVTFDGSGAQSITNTLGETFWKLTIDKSAGTLTLNNDASARDTLTMTQGLIDASTGMMILGFPGTEGTLNYSDGCIIGKFKRFIKTTTVDFLYPLGTATYCRPGIINFYSFVTDGSVIGEFVETDPGSNGLPLGEAPLSPADSVHNTFVEGYWSFTSADAFDFSPATNFLQMDLVGSSFNSFNVNLATRLLTRANAGSPWTLNGTHVDANPDTAKRDSISVLSGHYCFGDTTDCTPPVTGTITGPDSVCTDASGSVYSVPYSPPPITNFYWTITGGTQVSGGNNNSITVDWGATGQVGQVEVFENNGCTNSMPVTKTVNIHTLPTSVVTGNNSVGENAVGETYSVVGMSGYTYTWSITGGTLVSPQGNDTAIVDWGVAGSGTVRVTASTTCGSADPVDLPITVYSTIVSNGTGGGDWDQPTTWNCGCDPPATGNALILAGDTVTLNVNRNPTINNLTINGRLEDPAAFMGGLTITGNLTVDGTYYGEDDLKFKGTSMVTLGGTGSITIANGKQIKLEGGNVNISASADLTVTVNVFKFNKAGVNVFNYGTINIGGDIVQKDAASTWFNKTNSTLNIDGDLFTGGCGGGGVLVASETGNTVNYNSTADQIIKYPNSGQYYHLTLSGSGIKLMECDNLDVDGNLAISATSELDVASYDIAIAGNWINTSTAAFDPKAQTVTFDGSGAQSITATGGETFRNLTVNKGGDTLTLNNNVTVSGLSPSTLTMTSGNINTGTDTLKLGKSCTDYGTLIHGSGTIVGRFERWIKDTGTPVSPVLFPVGTAGNYRPAFITFNAAGFSCGSLTGEFIETDPGVNGLFLVDGVDTVFQTFSEGYWDLNANGLTSTDYDLQLVGTGFSSGTITAGTRILVRPNASSAWALEGSHIAGTPNTVKRNTFTALSAQHCLGDTAHCTPPVTPAISGPDSVCTDSLAAAYTVTAGSPYSTFTWVITGGAQVSGGSTNSITVDWGSTGMVGSVKVVESSSCGFSDTVTKAVNLHTLPTSAITGKIQGLSEFGPPEPYSVVGRPGYTYTWSTAQGGGTIFSGQGTNSITINWDSTGIDTVRVIAITACDSADTVMLPVTIYGTIVSIKTGFWDTLSTWDCNCNPLPTDNVVIDSNHVVTLTKNDTANFLVIRSTGTLNDSTFDFTVTGDYTVHGTHTGGGDINVTGVGVVIAGAGTISNNGQLLITGNKTIFSSANLTVTSSQVTVAAGDTVTNNGTITIADTVVGGDGTSAWVNGSNSILNIGGELLTTGGLVASASGNTVNYNGAGNQTVKCPSAGQYYYFRSSGGGIKTLVCNIDVNGNLVIDGTSRLDASATDYNVNLAGNWTNTSTDATSFEPRNGEVIFDGAGAQSVTATGGEGYYDLTINKSANALTLNDNVTVSATSGGALTLTSGNILTGTDTLKLGTSCANVGTVVRTGGAVVGRFERWIASTVSPPAPVLYPVGNTTTYRPELVTFNAIGTCGSLTGEFVSSDPGGNGLPLNDSYYTVGNAFTQGYWSLTASGLASTDYDLDLVATGFTSYPIVAQTRLLKRVDAAGGWNTTDWGTHANTSGDTIRRTALSDISNFDFGVGDTSGCSGLPATTVIAGLDSVCAGDAGVTYSVDDHSPNLYFWSVSGGTQVGGTTTNSITVNWGTTGQVGSVSVIERDECGNRTSVNLPVNIHLLPTSAITGNTLMPINTPDESYEITANAGYTYTWTTLQGLGTVDFGPNGDSITIDWGAVSGNDTVRVVASITGCGTDTALLPVNLRGKIISIDSKDWDDTLTWDCNCVPLSTDNVIIDNDDVVTLVAGTSTNTLTIRGTGTLNNAAYIMTVTGNYTVNGIHSGSGPINLTGTGTIIDGTGTVSNSSGLNIQTTRTVTDSANITISDNFSIDDGLTVTNNGAVHISGNLSGGGSSNWINTAGSTLRVAGALLTSGTLTASADPNLVVYNGGGNQTVKATQYWNVTFSTGGTKTLGGAIDIDGVDLILIGATLASANYGITLAGNWVNNGSFTAGTGTITFDGTTTVGGISTTAFNNITISGGGALTGHVGNMNVAGNWTNSGTYTHNSGTVIFTGSTTVSGGSTTTFNNVTIPGTLIGHATNMIVRGNWNNSNVFTHNGGTVTFNNFTAISGASTNTFNHIVITGGSTLNGPAGVVEIAGNWTNNGSYGHSGGQVTFAGTSTVSGTATTTFSNVRINAAATLIGHATSMNVTSNWTNNGTFTHNGGKISFSGTSVMAGTGTTNFNHLTIASGATLVGPASDTIGVAGDLSSGTFTHNNGVVILNGTTAQTITSEATNTFYTLVVNNSTPANAITLGAATVIENNLTLTDGHVIVLVANPLTLGGSATVTLDAPALQDSSFVKGPMRHTVNVATPVTKVFPIGKGTEYKRVDLIVDQSVVTPTLYTAEEFESSATSLGYSYPATIDMVSSYRYYQIDQSIATALDSAKVRIYYSANDSVLDAPNLAIAKDNGASSWIDLGGIASGAPSGSILSGPFTTFSRFALANKKGGGNPLPIELLSFDAEQIEDVVEVTWTTTTEVNNDFFTVERSGEGQDFEFLTYMQGAGNSNTLRDYSYIDANPLYGTSYYRLMQTDYDGTSRTFPMVAVQYEERNEIEIAVYPNPAKGKFYVDIDGYEGDEVLVVVMDMLGREHFSKVVILDFDGYTLAFDPSQKLSPGVYMVVGTSNNKLYSKKLVIR